MDNQFYAIYGTASSSDIGTTRVYTSDSKIVKLGPNGSVVALTADNGDPMWDDVAAAGKTTMAKGGFSILTDHTFKVPNESKYRLGRTSSNLPRDLTHDSVDNIYIGVGAHDPKETDSVIPIQTYVAEPGLNSQLFPKMCYYICTGEYQPGMIVDRNTIGKALKVDFTGASIPKAVFTVNDFGVYTDEDGVNTKNGINWEMESVPDA